MEREAGDRRRAGGAAVVTTANWITILVVIVGFAATWGGLLVRVRVTESQCRDGERSRERQGLRCGALEDRMGFVEGALAAQGVPIPTPARARTRSRAFAVAVEAAGDPESDPSP